MGCAVIMVYCSSLGLMSLNQPSPSTWSSDADLQVRGWRAFLRSHAPDIAALDLFVVPTIGFKLLYGFVIVGIDRREPDLDRRHNQPYAGMDRTPDHRGVSLGRGSGLMIRDRDRA